MLRAQLALAECNLFDDLKAGRQALEQVLAEAGAVADILHSAAIGLNQHDPHNAAPGGGNVGRIGMGRGSNEQTQGEDQECA